MFARFMLHDRYVIVIQACTNPPFLSHCLSPPLPHIIMFKKKQRMFLKFYPESHKEAEMFASQLKEVKLSMALLQGFFMTIRSESAVTALSLTASLEQEAKEVI
jgi:hypothetical protein